MSSSTFAKTSSVWLTLPFAFNPLQIKGCFWHCVRGQRFDTRGQFFAWHCMVLKSVQLVIKKGFSFSKHLINSCTSVRWQLKPHMDKQICQHAWFIYQLITSQLVCLGYAGMIALSGCTLVPAHQMPGDMKPQHSH